MVERVDTCWFTPEDPGRWLHPLRYRLDHVLLLHLEGRQVDWQGKEDAVPVASLFFLK